MGQNTLDFKLYIFYEFFGIVQSCHCKNFKTCFASKYKSNDNPKFCWGCHDHRIGIILIIESELYLSDIQKILKI